MCVYWSIVIFLQVHYNIVGEMQIFAFSNRSLGYFRHEKPVKRARGCCVHVFLVIISDLSMTPVFLWEKASLSLGILLFFISSGRPSVCILSNFFFVSFNSMLYQARGLTMYCHISLGCSESWLMFSLYYSGRSSTLLTSKTKEENHHVILGVYVHTH